MAKKDEDTQQLPAVKPSERVESPELAIPWFANKIEDLMNEAVQQSIPFEGQPANEHHQRFAHWANHLGDLWREVKQHA